MYILLLSMHSSIVDHAAFVAFSVIQEFRCVSIACGCHGCRSGELKEVGFLQEEGYGLG